MDKVYKILCQFVVLCLCSGISLAQQFTLKGKVIDSETGDALPGASVQVKGIRAGTSTNMDGTFEIKGIRNDKIELSVSFISYESYSERINFNDAVVFKLVKLKPVSEELEQVEVYGQTKGQVKAMLEQKTAENIKNVVSAEQIEKFPDMNAAEAVQRIPGITLKRDQGEGRFVQLRGTPPEYTNFSINGEQIPSAEGDVRYVGLDILSADQIEFVEVTKVLTPDMDADGIAGNVNIITKTAQSEMPEVNASLAGGYHNLSKKNNSQLQFSYGQKYSKLSFNVNASHFENNQGSHNMEFEYDKLPFRGSAGQGEGNDNYHNVYTELQLRHYEITRVRTNVSTTLELTPGNNSKFFIRGIYSRFSDDEIRRRKIYTLDDPFNETFYTYGGVVHDIKDRVKIQNNTTINIGGEQRFKPLHVSYEFAYSLASDDQPDRLEVEFKDDVQAIPTKINLDDPNWPRVYYPSAKDSANAFNYGEFELDEMWMLYGTTRDENITAKIDFKVPFVTSIGSSVFQFGGKVRLKDKGRDYTGQAYSRFAQTTPQYYGEAPDFNITTIQDDFSESNLLNKGYLIDNMPSPDKIRDFYSLYPQHFIFSRSETTRLTNEVDYQANENIYAGYGMLKLNIKKLNIIAGARYEQTDIDYQGRLFNKEGIQIDDMVDTLTDKRTHSFFLPQAVLRYRYTNNLNIRFGVAKAYSRPNFEDVLPFRQEDRREVQYGNPSLRYPVSINYDFLIDYYFQRNGLISGGIFHKDIKDFVFFYVLKAYEDDPTTGASKYDISIPLNGNKASVYGAEITAQFKFDFLPGFWSNFGIFSNYTYTLSEAFIYNRPEANEQRRLVTLGGDYYEYFETDEQEKVELPGQAKHTANIAFYYESEKMLLKVSGNYQDHFLDQFGVDSDLDEYYDAAFHLDFTGSLAINRFTKLFIDVINITNTPLRYYLGTPDNLLKQEYYSWWGRAGIKLSF